MSCTCFSSLHSPIHYITWPTYADRNLTFFLSTCSQWRVAKLCLLALTHLTASLSICLHVAVGELLNICSWNLVLECIANICWLFNSLLNSLEWKLFWIKVYPQCTFSVIVSVFKTIKQKQVNVSEVFCVYIS